MERRIIPSIIAKTQEELDKRIGSVKDHFQILQLDIMDGKFVESHSLDFNFKLPTSTCRYEAHLMINNPEEWIKKNIDISDVLLIHIESCKEPLHIIDYAKKKGKKIGFVINPSTNVDAIEQYLPLIDEVLVMTVNPGFYGSPFLPKMLDKVKEIRKKYPKMDIEVDGGISPETVGESYRAGANLFVCGSFLQKTNNIDDAIKTLESSMR